MRAAETLFVILLVCSSCGDEDPALAEATLQVINDAGDTAELQVELARTREQRRVGLMNRQELAPDAGMLFIFNDDQQAGFWMKDTYIPLDIAFLAEDGTIQEIRQGIPLSTESLRPEDSYRYALEVNQGWFEAHGYGVGDRVVIPDAVTAAARQAGPSRVLQRLLPAA